VARSYAYTSILEAHNQRWLLALDVVTSLPPESSLAPTFEALARERLRIRSRVSFISAVDYRANRIEAPAILQQALTLPEKINPRARALASEWQSLPPEKDRRDSAGDVPQGRFPLHAAPAAARRGRRR
jgi:hypothetical protein